MAGFSLFGGMMGAPQRMQMGSLADLMANPAGAMHQAVAPKPKPRNGEMQKGEDGKTYRFEDDGGEGRWMEVQQESATPRMDNFRGNLRDMFSPENMSAWGAMAGGRTFGDSLGGFLQASGQNLTNVRAERKATEQKNKTLAWLQSKNPEIAQAVEMGVLPMGEAYKAMKGGGDQKLTDDMREYAMAVQQGFQGSFMDYQVKMKEAGRQQVNIDTGVKLPTGYQWKDPNNQDAGVTPIPGGPATQMPAELAARIGMADSFLGQLSNIKQQVATGQVTGPWDKTKAAAGYGEGGQTYRQIQSGVDALMRLLTGAGMNQTEAEQYARRYLPTYMDDANTMGQKLDQLERELKSAKQMATRGRGGDASGGDGWQDLGGGVRIRALP